ncbi:MAG: alkaline phosphatase [Verrucomicrobiota bacterium]|nr:alkaline phosphatase [Verrucomicrobiota bacterium]
MSVNRRDFVRLLGGGLAAVTGLPLIGSAETKKPTVIGSPSGKARNVIFMVSDGMTHGTLALAEQYSRYVLGKPTNWMNLYRKRPVVRALQETRSHSSIVTDSAAASSSWGCGQRVINGKINLSPEGVALTPIGVKAKRSGKEVGLVSTARITHATPAGFAANVEFRDQEDTIAEQYLTREIDVLLGGGSRHFDPAVRADKKDLFANYLNGGYTVVRNKVDLLKAASAKRLLGTFCPDHVPYTIDHQRNPELMRDVPTLHEMMSAALSRLEHSPNGFLLQVEGGRIDHAAHANDAGALLQEQLMFDSCIPLALEFQERHPDTLIIITTDHGTGGCHINGEGKEYADSMPMVANLQKYTVSFECLGQHLKKGMSAAQLQEKLALLYGLNLPASRAQEILLELAAIDAEGGYKYAGNIMAPLLAKHCAIDWTTHNHTGDLVEFAALGPGSERITPFIENWQVHGVVCQAMGIE